MCIKDKDAPAWETWTQIVNIGWTNGRTELTLYALYIILQMAEHKKK